MPTFKKLLPQAEHNRLNGLFNAGQYLEMENRARILVEQYPESGLAWSALGTSLQVQGKLALPALQKAVALLPVDAEAHSNLGAALMDLGLLNEAAASFCRAVQIKPDFAEAHFNLGNALQCLGQFGEAVVSFSRAAQTKPDFAEAHFHIGSTLQCLGQLGGAVASLRQALQIKPDSAETHIYLGNALQCLGQLDGAAASFRQALQIEPDFAEVHNNLGNTLRDQGQFASAIASFRRAIQIKPDLPEAHNNMGNVLRDQGQLVDSAASCRQALTIKPDFPEAYINLGASLTTLGQFGQAVASLHRALQIKFDLDQAHAYLGNTLQGLGQLDEAVASFRQALQINPDFVESHIYLGNALLGLGQPDGAAASFRRALQIKPDFAEVHNNLGNALRDQGQLDSAIASFHRAMQIKPDLPEAHNNMGIVLRDRGQLVDSAASCRQALTIRPDFPEAHSNLGAALRSLGQLDQAVTNIRRALQIKPDLAEAHINLGNALRDFGQLDGAVSSFRWALHFKPNFVDAHINLSNTLRDFGQLDSAAACCRQALLIKPDSAEAHINLSNAWHDLGKTVEAIACNRRALVIKPDYAEAASNLLFSLTYCSVGSPLEYLEEAQKWEHRISSQATRNSSNLRRFSALPRTGRRLRIGYVSGDFRRHAVSYFVESLFRIHDRSRVEVFAYPTSAMRDEVSDRMEKLVDHWEPLVGISDEEARRCVEIDKIDVLIDLSGHTAHNRLGVFARRAAPVQTHYLGYYASTGLTEMDYWIGDSILLPESEDAFYSEKIWRLPRAWVSYQGRDDAPIPQWRAASDGTVWLGSFNNLNKITPTTVALWAKLLHALPEGKLLLKTKGLGDTLNRHRIEATFAEYDIASNRLELVGDTPDWVSHMALYDRIDIALDPVGGVGGGTTTCDALWMGVPIITLAGQSMGQRMSASMLDAIGHPEWIAESDSEYVTKVVTLARNADHRVTLRFIQREKMHNSPLCDGTGLVRSLEEAYEGMFDSWWQTKLNVRSMNNSSCSNAENMRNSLC